MKLFIFILFLSFSAVAGLLYQETTQSSGVPVFSNLSPDEVSVDQKGGVGNLLPVTITEKPVRAYKATVSRPLFNPTRRPQSKIKEKIAAPKKIRTKVAGNDKVKLSAIIITPDSKQAMFTDQRSRTSVRVKEGETFGEWILSEIHEDKVVLSDGESSHEYLLHSYPPVSNAKRFSPKQTNRPVPRPRSKTPSGNSSGPVSLKKKTVVLPGKSVQF